MLKIALSYRRADTGPVTARVCDRLIDRFGEKSVFMDNEDIRPGVDFRKRIQEVLAQADVLIAVVGTKWLGHQDNGNLRIHEINDFVRIEIETALRKGITIIPLLVDGAKMP